MVRLAIARMHAGHLTIREAAEKCGLNYASWSNWEQGSRPRDLLGVVHAISEGLDIDHDWLLWGGALAGPRGMPTKRPSEDNRRFLPVNIRPRDARPNNRSDAGQGRATTGPTPRRPVRISKPQVA